MSSRQPPYGEPPDPSIRGDSIVVTWGMLGFGHLLGAVVSTIALLTGAPRGASDSPSGRTVILVVIAVLGTAGALVAFSILRYAARVRLAQARGRPIPHMTTGPLAMTSTFVLIALAVTFGAVILFGAYGVLPFTASALVFIPLAMRTERLIRDTTPQFPSTETKRPPPGGDDDTE